MASGYSFYDIFVQQKISLSKLSDDVIARDWWFGPLQSKILATPMLRGFWVLTPTKFLILETLTDNFPCVFSFRFA